MLVLSGAVCTGTLVLLQYVLKRVGNTLAVDTAPCLACYPDSWAFKVTKEAFTGSTCMVNTEFCSTQLQQMPGMTAVVHVGPVGA